MNSVILAWRNQAEKLANNPNTCIWFMPETAYDALYDKFMTHEAELLSLLNREEQVMFLLFAAEAEENP